MDGDLQQLRWIAANSVYPRPLSGVIESVAEDVNQSMIGVEVYGLTSFCRDGCAAEYVAVHADDLAPKPASLGHTEAAAVPLSALTVWQAFFDHAHLVRDQRVLIQAAAGGVGTFAVQIARWMGASFLRLFHWAELETLSNAARLAIIVERWCCKLATKQNNEIDEKCNCSAEMGHLTSVQS